MDQNALEAKLRITNLERQLLAARQTLEEIQRNCRHTWSQPIKEVADRLGLSQQGGHWQGVDYIPSLKVITQETGRYTRECSKCGKQEHSSGTNTETITKPVFK